MKPCSPIGYTRKPVYLRVVINLTCKLIHCVVRVSRVAAATSLCCCAEAAQAAMTVGVANVLCDERSAPLAWPAPPPAAPPAPLWPYPGESPPTDICDPGSYAPTALRDRRFSDNRTSARNENYTGVLIPKPVYLSLSLFKN